MGADVAERRCAEQCVRNRVQKHICIRMPEQTARIFDLHAAQNQISAFHQAVHVIAVADPHLSSPRIFKMASPSARSPGVVILMFS